MNITEIPPVVEWGTLLAANRTMPCGLASEEIRLAARSEVIDAAQRYSCHLREIAASVDIAVYPDCAGSKPGSFDCKLPIIMTGHQPVVYHSGLLHKNSSVSKIIGTIKAIGINVVIDTDEGDAGSILFPALRDSLPISDRLSIGDGVGLYLGQRVASRALVAQQFEQISQGLAATGAVHDSRALTHISELYQRLEGVPLVEANSIVRATFEKRTYLELPLSRLVQTAAIRRVLEEMIIDHTRLVGTYNTVLERHRTERKIKNAANPFPNLVVSAESAELPMWIVNEKLLSRRPALVIDRKAPKLESGEFFSPRGGLTTLLLRGICSDLFVHGLGGAKYDLFVDAWAREYARGALPQFAVASMTRYLFPKEQRSYADAEALQSQYKEIVSHTENFLENGLFSEEETTILTEHSSTRKTLLAELRQAQGPEKKSEVAHRLNALNKQIKELLDTGSLAQKLKVLSTPTATVDTWRSREFPYFMV